MEVESLLVGIPEVAGMLGISRWTVRKLIRNGSLPCVHIGRRVLVEVEEISKFIEKNRQ